MAAGRRPGRVPPVVADSVACIAAGDGTLCALKATTGQKLVSTAIGTPPSRPPRSRTGPSTPAPLASACTRPRSHGPAGSRAYGRGRSGATARIRPRPPHPAPPAAQHQMPGEVC